MCIDVYYAFHHKCKDRKDIQFPWIISIQENFVNLKLAFEDPGIMVRILNDINIHSRESKDMKLHGSQAFSI